MSTCSLTRQLSPACRMKACWRGYADDTSRKVALPLSTAPSRKLAIGLPELMPTSPVDPRSKEKLPA